MVKAEPRISSLHALAYGSLAAVTIASAIARRLALGRRGKRGSRLWIEASDLSGQQRELILESIGGRTMKEIAFAHGLAYSTVRGILSSSYRRLHVSGMRELAVEAALRDARQEREDREGVPPGPPNNS